MNRDLINQYKILHAEKQNYGSGGAIKKIMPEINKFSAHQYGIKKVFDFGCGKGSLVKRIEKLFQVVVGYDPAIPEFSEFKDDNYDLVISTDVFEHLDIENIDDEVGLISSLCPHYILLNIAVNVAKNFLPNGLNCHTIVWSPEQWIEFCKRKFSNYDITQTRKDERGAPSVIIVLKRK